MLRGPVIKSEDTHHGWIDLTSENMKRWQERMKAIDRAAESERDPNLSSGFRQFFSGGREDTDFFDICEVVAWIFQHEEGGKREKA